MKNEGYKKAFDDFVKNIKKPKVPEKKKPRRVIVYGNAFLCCSEDVESDTTFHRTLRG